MDDPPLPSPGGGRKPGLSALIRRIALEILMEAEGSGKFVDEVLAARIGDLEEKDRRLLQEMVFGAVRHMNTLDHLLNFHLKFPMVHQVLPVRWALRLGTYQLVYLGRIPAHAALHQTLEALKALAGVGLREVGFANAVLRKISSEVRLKSEEPPLDRDDPACLPIRLGHCHFQRPVMPLIRLGAAAHLAIKYSHPRWLIERWLDRYGEEETRRLCEVNNITPRLIVRVRRLAPSREEILTKLREEGWKATPGNLDDSIILERGGDLKVSETFSKGWLQAQDETSIRIGGVLHPPPGARVLDLCSAPGGKAAQLLEAIGSDGHLLAADRSDEKLALVTENLSRIGTNFTTMVVPEDPARLDLGQSFSHILVDAPCSNTGVLARRPEARWRIRPRDLESLSALQKSLLEAALRHLEPGGRLLYATCSIEPEENEEVIASVFQGHDDLVERETHLFLPHRTPGDGGFCSLLVRER